MCAARLFNIAHSSAAEVTSELDVAIRLAYPHADQAGPLMNEYDELSAMINALTERVKASRRRPRRTDTDDRTNGNQ